MGSEALILTLDAPLVSFGGVAVDQHGVVDRSPALSLITGLLANALGSRHGDFERLARLQHRLRIAARCDVPGEPIVDFQTVDLGQGHMAQGWTTWGRPESRKGGEAATGTHIRYRHYRADSVHTVAVMLEPADEAPTLDDLEAALREPARPLFIGRKCCLPSGPIFAGRCEAGSPIEALRQWPRLAGRPGLYNADPLEAWWEADDGATVDEADRRLVPVTDRRDWANQLHTGRRLLWHGRIDPPEAT